MDDEQIKEASWVAQSVTGISAYLYGIGYNREQFDQELNAMVEYIKKSAYAVVTCQNVMRGGHNGNTRYLSIHQRIG
jgi:hypothetical protein